MKKLFLVLAVIGAILPYLFFIQHLFNEGFSPSKLTAAVFTNPGAGAFTTDLLLSSGIFWIFMFLERSRKKGPHPLLFILLNCLIGLSCALPAYLYAREGMNAQKGV